MPTARDFKVFAGNSNLPLTRRICEHLKRPLGKAEVGRFSDGEIQIEIGENVRGQDTFIVQSTSPPANDHIMELLIMCDALKRASAQSITAVIPYFGYARQDRKVVPRTPITAKLVADLLESAGATRVVSMDMHVAQIQGFIVDKRRTRANVSEVMNLIGDVRGRDAVLIDDMVDTAGTLTQAALALKNEGARRVVAYAVHPILSGPAVKRIQESVLEEAVFTDTVPLGPAAAASSKIRQLSTARLFADAIQRIYSGDSLSSLFV